MAEDLLTTEYTDDELVTIDEAAKIMNCPASRIREWISSGQLVAEPAGSIERVRRGELHRLGDPDKTGAKEFEKKHG